VLLSTSSSAASEVVEKWTSVSVGDGRDARYESKLGLLAASIRSIDIVYKYSQLAFEWYTPPVCGSLGKD